MWMGWVTFTDKHGDITKVDKSWGYKKDEARYTAYRPASFVIAIPARVSCNFPGVESTNNKEESLHCFQMRILPSVLY